MPHLLGAATAVPIHLSFFRAIVIGLFQGVTELFPISSLGHSVLLPALFGWHDLVKGQSASESGYLAFLVGLHVATALALLVFFLKDWIRIVTAGLRSAARMVRRQQPYVRSSDERLFWLLVLATIPVGILGLAFEHALRTVFAKPTAAAAFLMVNGLIMLGGERLRRRASVRALATTPAAVPGGDTGPTVSTVSAVDGPSRRLETLAYREGFVLGLFQSLALLAGISRSGVTMVGGLARGLDHKDAARFSFLAATPVILAAGVYKVPDLTGPLGNGIRGQVLAGSAVAALAAFLSVRFLVKWFETRTLTPFAVYSLAFGTVCVVGFGTGVF